MIKKWGGIPAIILVLLLVITGCGGGGTTTAVSTTPPPVQTTAVTPTTTTTQPAATTKPVTPAPTTAASAPVETQTVTDTVTPPPPTTATIETVTPPPTTVPPPPPPVFTLSSTAFANGAEIPFIHSYFAGNKSPALQWSGPPAGTVSFVLIMDDPDGGDWSHWVVFNIPSDVLSLAEGLPKTATLTNGARQGMNDFGETGYGGPSPPSGIHHYYFRLYALDTNLNLTTGVNKASVINAMQGHILGQVEYMGTYRA